MERREMLKGTVEGLILAATGNAVFAAEDQNKNATTQTAMMQNKFRGSVSVFDFMSVVQIADVQTRTASIDMTAAAQAAANSLIHGGILYYPAGKYLQLGTITCLDETIVSGDGVDVTYILSSIKNITGAFLRTDAAEPAIPTQNSFGVQNITIDMGHKVDRTSTTLSGGQFAQWIHHNTYGIYVTSTEYVTIQNVRVINAGTGLIADSNSQLMVDGFRAEGMQWDGVAIYHSQQMTSLKNIYVKTTGRDGVFASHINGQVGINEFYIADTWCIAIELEQTDKVKHCNITDGFVTDCGCVGGVTSNGVAGYGTFRNVYCEAPKIHAAFNNRTTGEADQYYNVIGAVGYKANGNLPAFPVPNVPGTWPNIRFAGVLMEVAHSVIEGCSFINMSTSSYAYAYKEPNSASYIDIKNCYFNLSNVAFVGGEYHNISGNYFINSTLEANQTAVAFTQTPSTIIDSNMFVGSSNLFISDNATITNNIFRNIVGKAIKTNDAGLGRVDGKTTIANNSIIDSRGVSSTMTFGIYLGNASSINYLIHDNYIFGATASPGIGIELNEAGVALGIICKDNIIDTCIFGIESVRANGTIITGNICRNNSKSDISLYGNGGACATGVRIVGNILQSAVSVSATSYKTLPGISKFINNEYVALIPANIWTVLGTNVVQGNWT